MIGIYTYMDGMHVGDRVKVLAIGLLSGFAATLMVAGVISAGEALANYPHGLFYLVIGGALGFGTNVTYATSMGITMHIAAGTMLGLIATVPLAVSSRMLMSISNINRSLIYGVIFGLLVWALFFIPVSYMLVMPALSTHDGMVLDRSGSVIMDMSALFTKVIYYAIGIHIQYGVTYSILTGVLISRTVMVLPLER